jgi:uncharacterized membrane protein (DUF373 family)
MSKFFSIVEKAVISVLAMLMALVLLLSVIELGWIVARDILSPPVLLLDVSELLDLFGFFLLVLIGIELLVTIKTYFKEHVVHVEVVVEVALIAIARKVIILDVKEYEPLQLAGIALIIASLAAAYFVIKRSQHLTPPKPV